MRVVRIEQGMDYLDGRFQFHLTNSSTDTKSYANIWSPWTVAGNSDSGG